MKIRNNTTSEVDTSNHTSPVKTILMWVIFGVVMIGLGGGVGAVFAQYQSRGESGEPVDEPLADVLNDGETNAQVVEQAVDDALERQAQIHAEEMATLRETLDQFEQDDMEGYQAQVADLQQEIESLREANDKLREANESLSESNEELSQRTTVSEIQEAYDTQIERLEAENETLTELLADIQRRLEGGQ